MIKRLNFFLTSTMLIMVIYQLFQVWWVPGPRGGAIIHIFFALTVAILLDLQKNVQNRMYVYFSLCALLINLICSYYFYINQTEILTRVGMITYSDMITGLLMICLILYYVTKVFGITFTIIGLVFISYVFLGPFLPDLISGPKISFNRIISHLTIRMYGDVVGISASFMFLFIIFGTFLQISGGSKFIFGIAQFLSSILKGGVGLVTVGASALVAMFTGAGGANSGITGPITIPLMRKSGYSANTAAAIEAVASVGGAITPPVLGTAAFLMSEFLNISYLTIVISTIIPAIIFYFSVFLYIWLYANKHGLTGFDKDEDEPTEKGLLIKGAILFIVPMTILICLMLEGFSLSFCAFFTILSSLALSLIFKTEKRMHVWIDGISSGVKIGVGIALASVILDIVIAILSITQLGYRFGGIISTVSGDNIFALIILCMFVSYVLGMGMPSIAVYILTATLVAPTLIKFGIEPLIAHMMVYVGAILGNITPPIASGVLVASQIAGSDYLKSGVEAVKIASSTFLLPLFFFITPELIKVNLSLYTIGLALLTLCAVAYSTIGLIGYFGRNLYKFERVMCFGITILIMISMYIRDMQLMIGVLITVLLSILYYYLLIRKSGQVYQEKKQIIGK
ncbi:TRAP transporter permease [Bacillus sp. Marseille-P3661]|uniref:TRAP transporter permease n=1 Tax=Bacillus sp. Marseille-P3661 TaxID=1936234 RepID=UPI000C839B42|nr:TRAP transporter fused permease subunit [Bacillus sp. Marseille-P3661]